MLLKKIFLRHLFYPKMKDNRIMWDNLKQKRKDKIQTGMNKENASKLWKIIQEAGDYLKGQLPDHPNHPKGRNPYAHVAICVKSKFQKSYKDIEDDRFQEVLDYIVFLKKNPS